MLRRKITWSVLGGLGLALVAVLAVAAQRDPLDPAAAAAHAAGCTEITRPGRQLIIQATSTSCRQAAVAAGRAVGFDLVDVAASHNREVTRGRRTLVAEQAGQDWVYRFR